MKLAKELEKNPNVKEVLYPNRGAMLSFKLHDASKIDKFLRSLKIAIFAESLGGVETFSYLSYNSNTFRYSRRVTSFLWSYTRFIKDFCRN